MVEQFLSEMYRRLRPTKVGIVLSGTVLSKEVLNSLPKLRKRIKDQVGEIRIAEIIHEKSLPPQEYEILLENGFSSKIIPVHLELGYLLEVYDLVLQNQVDLLILGSTSSNLLPLFNEIRKKVSLFLLSERKELPKGLVEAFDQVIYIDEIEDYEFEGIEKSIENLETIIEDNGKETERKTRQYHYNDVDSSSIGIISEKSIEEG